MTQTLQAVLWDMDGTLVDTEPYWYNAEVELLDEYGKPKRKPRRKVPFIELAVEHVLASPDTADKTYRKALGKMKRVLSTVKNHYDERKRKW